MQQLVSGSQCGHVDWEPVDGRRWFMSYSASTIILGSPEPWQEHITSLLAIEEILKLVPGVQLETCSQGICVLLEASDIHLIVVIKTPSYLTCWRSDGEVWVWAHHSPVLPGWGWFYTVGLYFMCWPVVNVFVSGREGWGGVGGWMGWWHCGAEAQRQGPNLKSVSV